MAAFGHHGDALHQRAEGRTASHVDGSIWAFGLYSGLLCFGFLMQNMCFGSEPQVNLQYLQQQGYFVLML